MRRLRQCASFSVYASVWASGEEANGAFILDSLELGKAIRRT